MESKVPARVQPEPAPLERSGVERAPWKVPVLLASVGVGLLITSTGQHLGVCAVTAGLTALSVMAWHRLSRRPVPALSLRHEGDRQFLKGCYSEARRSYERALDLAANELPRSSPELARHYFCLAAVNARLEEHVRADQYLDKLLRELDQQIPAAWQGQVALLMRQAAQRRSLDGRHREAFALCRRALDLVGDAPGADDASVPSLLDDLAWIRYRAGDFSHAEALFADAVGIHELTRDVLASSLERGPRIGDDSPYRSAGPQAARTSGGLDRALARSLIGLGWAMVEGSRHTEADACFERAYLLAMSATNATGDGTPEIRAEALRGRAAIQRIAANLEAAADLCSAALGALEATASSSRAAVLIELAHISYARSDLDECQRCYDQAGRLLARLGPLHTSRHRLAFCEGFAQLHLRRGQTAEAFRFVGQANALAEHHLGAEHPRRSTTLALASRVHTRRSDLVPAERLARRCLQVLRAAVGPEHPRMAEGYLALGEVHLARGHLGAARQALSRAAHLRESHLGPHHPSLVEVLEPWAAVLHRIGRDDAALGLEARVADILARSDSESSLHHDAAAAQ